MNDVVFAPAVTATPAQQEHQFEFTGQGGEYFRIWIVNLLLTIVTLGLYSAWAKVRREQYFHRNTLLDGSGFEYHGQPWSILKGRIIVVAAILVYNLLGGLSPVLGVAGMIVLLVATPWIICQAIRFRAANTSWRGVHLSFTGTVGGVARVYLLNGLLVLVTLGLAGPWWLNRFQTYLFSNLRFGGQQFAAYPSLKAYYRACFAFLLFMVLGVVAIGVVAVGGVSGASTAAGRGAAAMLMATMVFGFYIGMYFFAGSYLRARLGNALWNDTRVGPHAFVSDLRARRLFVILLTNALGIVCTLGLFLPVAKVRMARYRAATLSLLAAGSLDDFVAEQEQQVRALGEQAAELLDVDLGF